MTETEARKKAEEWASHRCSLLDPGEKEIRIFDKVDGYMECYRDMMAGEPDRWLISNPGGAETLYNGNLDDAWQKAREDALFIIRAYTFEEMKKAGWSVKPVKILVMEGE